MAELLRILGEALPLVAVAVSLCGGAMSLAYVNRGAMRLRPDRRAAATVAVVLGVAVGVVAAWFAAAIGSAWGGGDIVGALPVATIVFGAPAAAIVIGASVLGYALMSRWRSGAHAVAGSVLGPLVLGAAGLGAYALVGLSNQMVAAAALELEQQEVADQSRGLHLTVDEVVSTLNEEGLVETVQVRLTIRADTDVAFQLLPGKLVYPIFVIAPAGSDDPNVEIQAQAPPDSPSVLTAGSATQYEVSFDTRLTGTPSLSPPGDWLLSARMGGANGEQYGLEASITVPGT